jgi:DNA polymerase-3 subunit gamma/tau
LPREVVQKQLIENKTEQNKPEQSKAEQQAPDVLQQDRGQQDRVQQLAAVAPRQTAAAVAVPASREAVQARGEVIPLANFSADNWCEVLEQQGLAGIVYNIAANCELRSVVGDNVEFILNEVSAALFNDGHRDKIQKALSAYFGSTLIVSMTPGVTIGETPAARGERVKQERQAQAVRSIEGDEQLQALVSRFDGELDRASIAPIVSDQSRGKK